MTNVEHLVCGARQPARSLLLKVCRRQELLHQLSPAVVLLEDLVELLRQSPRRPAVAEPPEPVVPEQVVQPADAQRHLSGQSTTTTLSLDQISSSCAASAPNDVKECRSLAATAPDRSK